MVTEKEVTEEKKRLLEELVRLGDRLSLIYWYGWLLPFLNHEKEERILRRMKEIVNQLL